MLEFQNVSFQYEEEDNLVFEDLSFHVNSGDFISLIGASGCGKSTVFRLINGLEKMQKGSICIQEQKSHLGLSRAYMPQKDLLFPWRTVWQNVALPLELFKVSKKERESMSKQMLTKVGLGDCMDKYPSELSGGMRQRVSFVRTLIGGSKLLLLDEPFSALDSLTKIFLQEWLLELWEQLERTILFVTHDVEEAIFLSSKIFVMKDRPVSRLEEIEIPLPYPRKREDLSKSEIVNLKAELIQNLCLLKQADGSYCERSISQS